MVSEIWVSFVFIVSRSSLDKVTLYLINNLSHTQIDSVCKNDNSSAVGDVCIAHKNGSAKLLGVDR